MRSRLAEFVDKHLPDSRLRSEYALADTPLWQLAVAREKLRNAPGKIAVVAALYRPFDIRAIVYSDDIVRYTARPTMQHLDGRKNLALLVSQQQITEGFAHVFVTRVPADWGSVSNKSRESTSAFPLYMRMTGKQTNQGELIAEVDIQNNFKGDFLRHFSEILGLRDLDARVVFDYCYGTLHSPSYRSRYASLLKSDFPRLPLTWNEELLKELAELGNRLVSLHLLESPKLDKLRSTYVGPENPQVEKVFHSHDTVWIDKAQTHGFREVSEKVWNFNIGSYQVCEKWLKDRKGRALSNEDISHYHKIVVALSETIRLMDEIDRVIESHGGWPRAFQSLSP